MNGTGRRRTVSGFERSVFSFTRALTMVAAVVVILAIVFLVIKILSADQGAEVTYLDVEKALIESKTESGSGSTGLSDWGKSPQVEMPDNLKPYLNTAENLPVFRRWVKDLPENQQEDFVKNMSHVVKIAEQKGVNVIDVVNAYSTLKLERLRELPYEKYSAMARKAGYVATIIALLIMLSILSLILVMLAIERNTRSV